MAAQRRGAPLILGALALLAAIGPSRSATARTITDAAGRLVTLPERVTRVADPWHANNAMVLMLGGADKLVATSVQAQRQPWLQKLFPRIRDIPAAFSATGDVNLETLVGARPDVILMAYDGSLPKWADSVDRYHIPLVMMPNTSLEGLKTTALMTGAVLGDSEARVAADYVQYFDGNLRRVTAITSKLSISERPKVLHTASAGILTVDGRGTVVDDWIQVAGGINAADVVGNGRAVTLEQIAAWDPDVIIVGSAPNQDSRRAILADPRWQQIRAVKDGEVFVNPSGAYLWDRHSAEAALQVLWAAKTLHPARFQAVDMAQETKAFYARFFHYALSDADVKSILDSVPPP